jgi:hypothetical protein
MIRNRLELIGKRFGNGLVVSELDLETVGQDKKYPRQYQTWKLKCDCGTDYVSSSRYLLYGQGTHCGCKLKKDLIGQWFGKSEVIRYVGSMVRGKSSPRPSNVWELKCECGNLFRTHAEYLMSGTTVSCGCHKSNFHNTHYKKSFSQYFCNIKKDAKRRKLEFNISKEDLESLLKQQNNKCKLSELPISMEDGSASLDRIDNTRYYELDNVQWVHRKVNYMKNTLNQEEFIFLCSLIHRKHIDVNSQGLFNNSIP